MPINFIRVCHLKVVRIWQIRDENLPILSPNKKLRNTYFNNLNVANIHKNYVQIRLRSLTIKDLISKMMQPFKSWVDDIGHIVQARTLISIVEYR